MSPHDVVSGRVATMAAPVNVDAMDTAGMSVTTVYVPSPDHVAMTRVTASLMTSVVTDAVTDTMVRSVYDAVQRVGRCDRWHRNECERRGECE